MNVAIVVVTHNRLEYTRKTLKRFLEDLTEEFDLYLWDNASNDETPEYLKNGIDDPRIVEVVLSKENLGQTGAMNYVWGKTKAELVGKLDNDCLVTPGWTRVFARAHKDIKKLGAVACWHYPLDEFNENAARKAGKIQSFDGHQIFRHPWVCGSGFLMKRSIFQEIGPWEVGCDVGTTSYFLKMALGGEINGWYYPLIYQEHMDDPVSDHSVLKDDITIGQMYEFTYTLRSHDIRTMEERMRWRESVLYNLLCDPWDVKHYSGWRRKLRILNAKLRQLRGATKHREKANQS